MTENTMNEYIEHLAEIYSGLVENHKMSIFAVRKILLSDITVAVEDKIRSIRAGEGIEKVDGRKVIYNITPTIWECSGTHPELKAEASTEQIAGLRETVERAFVFAHYKYTDAEGLGARESEKRAQSMRRMISANGGAATLRVNFTWKNVPHLLQAIIERTGDQAPLADASEYTADAGASDKAKERLANIITKSA